MMFFLAIGVLVNALSDLRSANAAEYITDEEARAEFLDHLDAIATILLTRREIQ